MSLPSDSRLLVLHAVGLKGVAGVDALVTATGLVAVQVAAVLEDLAEAGWAQRRGGALPGWALTAVGRKERAVLLEEELEAAGARPGVEAAYRRFLTVNPELLAACTAWQLRDAGGATVPNDHTDAAHDAEVVGRLAELDAGARPVLAELAAALARFGPYRARLDHALHQVEAGAGDWFTGPLIDSYHTVWFELHQDLLDTLGIERGSEADR